MGPCIWRSGKSSTAGLATCTNVYRQMSRDTNGAPVVHFTTLTTTASADTCSLQTLTGEEEPSQMPPWKQAIAESKATFSAEHNLDGHVQERTWGIAASPSGDCIATCITLHPSDAVANIVPHVQKCLLLLSPCDSNVFYALQNPTAQEGNLFCPPVAEDLYFNRLQHPDNQPKQWADSCVSLIRNFAPESKDLPGELDPILLAESVRTKLYFEISIVKARFEVLAAMFKKDRRSISDKHHVILQGLMGQVSALASPDLHQGALGTRMAQCYAVLSDKLHAGETDEAAGSARNQEMCTICGQEIPMESIKWGRCSGGHQFQRCAVTMLPISDPSLSRSCRICATRCLDTTQVPELQLESYQSDSQARGGDSAEATSDKSSVVAEPRSSLARIMLAACDTCVLCGGRFGA